MAKRASNKLQDPKPPKSNTSPSPTLTKVRKLRDLDLGHKLHRGQKNNINLSPTLTLTPTMVRKPKDSNLRTKTKTKAPKNSRNQSPSIIIKSPTLTRTRTRTRTLTRMKSQKDLVNKTTKGLKSKIKTRSPNIRNRLSSKHQPNKLKLRKSLFLILKKRRRRLNLPKMHGTP